MEYHRTRVRELGWNFSLRKDTYVDRKFGKLFGRKEITAIVYMRECRANSLEMVAIKW